MLRPALNLNIIRSLSREQELTDFAFSVKAKVVKSAGELGGLNLQAPE